MGFSTVEKGIARRSVSVGVDSHKKQDMNMRPFASVLFSISKESQ